MIDKNFSQNFSVQAAMVDGASGSVFLVLLIIAIALAISALGGAIRVLWALTDELLRGLWSAFRAVLLLALALVCVILIAFSGRDLPSEPPDVVPPAVPSSCHQTPFGTEPPR